MKALSKLSLVLSCFTVACSAWAADIDPALQAKIDARVKAIEGWAADAAVVAAVKAVNEAPPAEYAAITQDKWKEMSVLDPVVRSLTKNPAAAVLKDKKDDAVSEAFISAANGTKVAFLGKTSGWSHKGKAKHDVPMTGKNWQGPVEKDDSTGLEQVQVAVPVLDGGKPIGSMVVGLSLTKLSQ